MNKVLLYSSFLFFLAKATEITKSEGLSASQKLNNEYFKIHDCDVNHVLHAITHENNNIETVKSYEGIQTAQFNDESIMLSKVYANAHMAKRTATGFWLSKFAVHVVAQIVYALAAGATALVYPPAAPVVYCSLQLTFAALVEFASTMIASGTLIAF